MHNKRKRIRLVVAGMAVGLATIFLLYTHTQDNVRDHGKPVRWKVPIRSLSLENVDSLAQNNQTLYVKGKASSASAGSIVAVDKITGEPQWKYMGDPISAAMMMLPVSLPSGKALCIAERKGSLCLLDAKDGKPLWRRKTGFDTLSNLSGLVVHNDLLCIIDLNIMI